MKDSDIKQTAIKFAETWGVDICASVFDGIVSKPTLYRWIAGDKNKELSYAYTTVECDREWKLLKTRQGNYNSPTCTNKIVLTYQPHFYHIEKQLWKNKDIQEKLLANRKKYLFKDTFNEKEILRGFKISGIHIGYSHFSPLWIKKFIEDTHTTSIYDPCGGWGHRLLGAASEGVDYIYNDKWNLSYNGVNNIRSFIGDHHSKVITYNNDCTMFSPPIFYDSVFTCPPYYNTEIYEDQFKSIEDYKAFIIAMLSKSIVTSVKCIGIVINTPYKDIIIDSVPINYKLSEEIVLGSTNAVSHFNKGTSTKQEILLIFTQNE